MTRVGLIRRGRKAVSAMQLDIERYRPYVDQFDMSEDRKIELIEVVSRIMQSFVDRAFGDAPEQILLGIAATKCPAQAQDRLDSINNLTPTFNDAAHEDAAGKSSP